MRILFICHHYRPEVGAPQRRWDAFIAEWARAGHEVTVVTPLPHYPIGRLLPGHAAPDLIGRTEGEHGESVVRVPFLPVGSRGGAAKLGNQAFVAACTVMAVPLLAQPDVVVSSVPGPATLAAADALAAYFRVPHVLELRDAWPDVLYEGAPSGVRIPRAFARWMTSRERAADAVVSVTESFADVLTRRGVHRDRIHHVSNGIDTRVVPYLREPTPRDGPLHVLYLGTHGVSQNLDNAVEALTLAGDRVEARFIGEGSEKRRLREMAERLGAPVSFEAPVHGEDLWKVYEWADTCLVQLDDIPAFEHTVPSKLYEIMALGRHVTAALTGEAASIIRANHAGTVSPPRDPDALAKALSRTAGDRTSLAVGRDPREWVEKKADLRPLSHRFIRILEQVVGPCG